MLIRLYDNKGVLANVADVPNTENTGILLFQDKFYVFWSFSAGYVHFVEAECREIEHKHIKYPAMMDT